jgi:hypothetical protein
MECVFCDRRFGTTPELCGHLIDAHEGRRVGPGLAALRVVRPPRRILRGGRGWVQCWCGRYFTIHQAVGEGSFAGHLDAAGGPAAHVLALVLGCNSDSTQLQQTRVDTGGAGAV